MTDKEPKFTPGPWKRTLTTIPNTTEGYDTSPDIVNITIGDRNIPLAVLAMNSSTEMREYFSTMFANAALMAAAPKMFNALRKCLAYMQRCPMTRNAELEDEIETIVEEVLK